MDVTKSAQNLTVTSIYPYRAGSYPGGYQVINNSLQATVWISDNPSVGTNNGTPVAPGTSVPWITNGDLYVCLGNDAQSLKEGKAALVLSYNISDWSPSPVAIAVAAVNSGLITKDLSTVLATNLLPDQFANQSIYDVSGFDSLFFQVLNTVGPSQDILFFTWYQEANDWITANNVAQDQVIWEFGTSRVGIVQEYQVPARARFVGVWTLNQTVTIGRLLASTRVAAATTIRNVNPYATTTLGGTANPTFALAKLGWLAQANLAVGATITLDTPPYWGMVEVRGYIGSLSTGATMLLSDGIALAGVNSQYRISLTNAVGNAVTLAGAIYNKETFQCNGHEMRWQLTNTAGAAANATLIVSPALQNT